MKNTDLIIHKVDIQINNSMEDVQRALNAVEWNRIKTINWSQYTYCPLVDFRLAYYDKGFLLQYKVKEQSVRAVAAHDNGEVWKDSCVEFFVSPADDGIYYNFEFNCVGVCLSATGAGRTNRESVPLELIAGIRRLPSLGTSPFQERVGETGWDLTLDIPFDCFFKHPNSFREKKTFKANFYKCGDDLSQPHFLSWQPIKTENPDFHRPEFFGTVELG